MKKIIVIMGFTVAVSSCIDGTEVNKTPRETPHAELGFDEEVQMAFINTGVWTTYKVNRCKWHTIKLKSDMTQIQLHFTDQNIRDSLIRLGPLRVCEGMTRPISFIQSYKDGVVYKSQDGDVLDNFSMTLENRHNFRGFISTAKRVALFTEDNESSSVDSRKLLADVFIDAGLDRNCISDLGEDLPTRDNFGNPDCN